MRYLVSLIAVTVMIAADPGAAGVDGRWRSVATSQGGIGSIVRLHGGVIDYSQGAVVEMKYRVEGTELVLPPAIATGPEQRQKLEYKGENRLRMTAAGNQAVEMTRVGPRTDASKPILGEWTAPREMNGKKLESRYIFYPGGKALLLLPFLTKSGTYSVQGARMKIDIPGLGSSDGSFTRAGDVLTLPLGKAGRVRFLSY